MTGDELTPLERRLSCLYLGSALGTHLRELRGTLEAMTTGELRPNDEERDRFFDEQGRALGKEIVQAKRACGYYNARGHTSQGDILDIDTPLMGAIDHLAAHDPSGTLRWLDAVVDRYLKPEEEAAVEGKPPIARFENSNFHTTPESIARHGVFTLDPLGAISGTYIHGPSDKLPERYPPTSAHLYRSSRPPKKLIPDQDALTCASQIYNTEENAELAEAIAKYHPLPIEEIEKEDRRLREEDPDKYAAIEADALDRNIRLEFAMEADRRERERTGQVHHETESEARERKERKERLHPGRHYL